MLDRVDWPGVADGVAEAAGVGDEGDAGILGCSNKSREFPRCLVVPRNVLAS